VLGRGGITEETWDDLEEALLRADVGVERVAVRRRQRRRQDHHHRQARQAQMAEGARC
jgi:signal recognition particle GTPase